LDGSTPSASSTLYSSTIGIGESKTLKAKAFKSQLSSGLMSEAYVISPAEEGFNYTLYHTPSVAVGASKVFTLNENSIIFVKKANVAFRGAFESIANGVVRVYKSGKLVKKVKVDKSGKWRAKVKLGRKGVSAYEFKYYNSAGQLVETTPSYRLMVDKKRPDITMGKTVDVSRGGTMEWQVADNDSIDHCFCVFRGKKYPVSEYSFSVPDTTPLGISKIKVTCYDRAGNKGSRNAKVNVR